MSDLRELAEAATEGMRKSGWGGGAPIPVDSEVVIGLLDRIEALRVALAEYRDLEADLQLGAFDVATRALAADDEAAS